MSSQQKLVDLTLLDDDSDGSSTKDIQPDPRSNDSRRKRKSEAKEEKKIPISCASAANQDSSPQLATKKKARRQEARDNSATALAEKKALANLERKRLSQQFERDSRPAAAVADTISQALRKQAASGPPQQRKPRPRVVLNQHHQTTVLKDHQGSKSPSEADLGSQEDLGSSQNPEPYPTATAAEKPPQSPSIHKTTDHQSSAKPKPSSPSSNTDEPNDSRQDTNENMKNLNIRVGILGNVSVGKSTILNTILGERYNPTSMRRCTSGIREFHLRRRLLGVPRKRKAAELVVTDNNNNNNDNTSSKQTQKDAARDIRDSIHTDNEQQREQDKLDPPMVIEIDDLPCNFFGSQRNDVELVFVDVPGLNETKKDLYEAWVTEHWSSFDCAIVVLDATHESATHDVECLWELVKGCFANSREIPIIFVANKVDDTTNTTLQDMVARMFNRLQKSFETVFDDIQSYKDMESVCAIAPVEPKRAAFVPISAQYALLFEEAKRGWKNLSSVQGFRDFMAADVSFDLIDQFGLEEVGKNKWRRLTTKEEKYRKVYEELKEKDLLEARIKDANFKTFEEVLRATVCGKERQTHLLMSQLHHTLKRPVSSDCMYDLLCDVQKKVDILGEDAGLVTKFFWEKFDGYDRNAAGKLAESTDPKPMAVPASQLRMFYRFVSEFKFAGSQKEIERVHKAFEELVHGQVTAVLKMFDEHWKEPVRQTRPPGCNGWDTVTPDIWADIFDSMLLAGSSHDFRMRFGPEIVAMQRATRKVSYHCCSKASEIKIPRSLDDDGHWGYVINSYCEFADLVKKASS